LCRPRRAALWRFARPRRPRQSKRRGRSASSTRWKRKTPKAPSAFRSVRVSLVDVAVVEFVPSVGGWAVVLTARCAGARHTRAPKAHFALLDATVTYVDVARPWAVPESASASAPRSLVSAALRSENDDQKTAFYSIGVGLEPHAQWAVRRRYRQFLELARRLEEAGFAAQPLPPRRVWWLTLSDGVLSERRDALDEFRCAVVADARLRDSPATIDFLGARDVATNDEPWDRETPDDLPAASPPARSQFPSRRRPFADARHAALGRRRTHRRPVPRPDAPRRQAARAKANYPRREGGKVELGGRGIVVAARRDVVPSTG